MSRTHVIVFVMKGCHACHDYLPRLKRIAAAHPGVPLSVLDANAKQHQPLADTHRISATPTTLVLRYPNGVMKAEGAIPDGEIQYLFQVAERYA